MRNYLNNAVHTVFVMLGPKCNLRCRYCLQSPLRADREREAVDPEVLESVSYTHLTLPTILRV